jgi:hypothetical protein
VSAGYILLVSVCLFLHILSSIWVNSWSLEFRFMMLCVDGQ